MLQEASFAVTATLAWLVASRTELVIVVMPPLALGLPLAVLARLRRSRVILHVQDLQPDAAIALGLLKPSRFTDLLLRLERVTYRLADRVSSISEAMLARIGDKGVELSRRILLRNWASDLVAPCAAVRDQFREDWALGNRFVVLYAGNLGRKQGLDMLIEAAHHLRTASDVVLVIVGEGSEAATLATRVADRALCNVVMQPLQDRERLSALLACADVHVIPQRAGVTDIVLPSKLGNILASARPVIVSALPQSELATIVRSGDCGLVVPPGDGAALAAAILLLRDDPAQRDRLGGHARELATTVFSARAILDEFVDEIERVVSAPQRSPRVREAARES